MSLLGDAFLTLRIAVFAAAVPLLARLPLRRLERLLEPKHAKCDMDTARAERIIRVTNRVCRIGRRFIPRRCMTRGLTLYFFLRRAGVNASLVFGAGTVKENFEGHCWLVRDGEPYLETTDPRGFFTPFYAFNGSVAGMQETGPMGAVSG